MALISATKQAMSVGSVQAYLHEAWFAVRTRTFISYAHHICRTHAIMKEQINTCYGVIEESITLFQGLMHHFRRRRDLWAFCHNVTNAVVISGK
jgi:hypothetical protein